MSEHLYLLTICLPFATILLVFGMRYFSAAHQARSRLAHDGAYQTMAAQAVAAESGNAVTLAAIEAGLIEVRTRLSAIEKVLKEVD